MLPPTNNPDYLLRLVTKDLYEKVKEQLTKDAAPLIEKAAKDVVDSLQVELREQVHAYGNKTVVQLFIDKKEVSDGPRSQ